MPAPARGHRWMNLDQPGSVQRRGKLRGKLHRGILVAAKTASLLGKLANLLKIPHDSYSDANEEEDEQDYPRSRATSMRRRVCVCICRGRRIPGGKALEVLGHRVRVNRSDGERRAGGWHAHRGKRGPQRRRKVGGRDRVVVVCVELRQVRPGSALRQVRQLDRLLAGEERRDHLLRAVLGQVVQVHHPIRVAIPQGRLFRAEQLGQLANRDGPVSIGIQRRERRQAQACRHVLCIDLAVVVGVKLGEQLVRFLATQIA
mmetsp:Transcript_28470/g.70782  ORF Transcript_28470/g.70782 Transcript_28470/m.70782 type:complete len:259 (-) Transcript_28470:892-1668(-)